MFRSQQQNELKQQQYNMEKQQTSDLYADDNYEFTGATLKINNNIVATINSDNNNQMSSNSYQQGSGSGLSETPAVLTGTDAISPPESMITTTTGSNTINRSSARYNNVIATQDTIKPRIGSPRHFFSFRKGLFEQAINDCINVLLVPINDNEIHGSWLLTEISHWDHERERLVILSSNTLYLIKYDFIALRILESSKVKLNNLDTIVRGKLTYPSASVVPWLEGLTNGLSTTFRDGIPNNCFKQSNDVNTSNTPIVDVTKFRPIDRNEIGIRLMWNRGKELSKFSSWNPFSSDIPWKTLTNHPIYNYKDHFNTSPPIQDDITTNNNIYSVNDLYLKLYTLYKLKHDSIDQITSEFNCKFDENIILLNNYIGVGAMLHNKNNLGFFKVRGKFSF